MPLPGGAPTDPGLWARHVFSAQAMPRWVLVLLGIRQVAVRLVGIPPAQDDVFRVAEVAGQEALIATSDAHLDFWAAVGVDPDAQRLSLTTVVKLHNVRGRLYWAVVRLLHPLVVAGMLRRAVARPPRPGHDGPPSR